AGDALVLGVGGGQGVAGAGRRSRGEDHRRRTRRIGDRGVRGEGAAIGAAPAHHPAGERQRVAVLVEELRRDRGRVPGREGVARGGDPVARRYRRRGEGEQLHAGAGDAVIVGGGDRVAGAGHRSGGE